MSEQAAINQEVSTSLNRTSDTPYFSRMVIILTDLLMVVDEGVRKPKFW